MNSYHNELKIDFENKAGIPSASADAIAQIFYEGDPTILACGGTLQDWTELINLYIKRMTEGCCCIIAKDIKSGKVIGAMLCEDYASEDPEGLEAFVEKSEGK